MAAKDLLLKILMEFRRSEILRISKDGEFEVRLVYPKGSEAHAPFHQSKVHFGFMTYGKKSYEGYVCAGKNCEMCAEYRRRHDSGDSRAEWFKAKVKYHYLALWNDGFRIFEVDWFLQREMLGIDADSLGPLVKAIESGIDPFSSISGRSIIISRDSANGLKYKLVGLSKTKSLSEIQLERIKNSPDIMSAYYRPSITESRMIVEWTNRNKSQSKGWEG